MLKSVIVGMAIGCFLMCGSCQTGAPTQRTQETTAPPAGRPYHDLIVTYAIYAKTLWHDADAGGYWGAGIAEHNANGAVRGMSNIAVGYAYLVAAIDNHWLSEKQLHRLNDAGLSRDRLIDYVARNLTHVAAHHKSADEPLEPEWGFSWQSSLWTGNLGAAALLVWKDLPAGVRTNVSRVVASEADRIVEKPPKDFLPGDTGAEENGWDTHAPAVALAMMPKHPHAAGWFHALKSYAVNTYSIKADQKSDERIGSDISKNIVTTANLFDDFTLDNHGFFHPDYIQVSGQELGEAWLYLQLGDRANDTHFARDFQPYALHHAKDVWENVAKPLVLPTGEFTFPNGTDWTINSSITPSYFAFIASALHDPVAYEAFARLPRQAMLHRDHSPPGRILGDTNLEWWWEPLLIKRSCTALLQLELRNAALPLPYAGEGGKEGRAPTTSTSQQFPSAPIDSINLHKLFPDSKVFIFRNQNYFASIAWGKRSMATFTPLKRAAAETPYLTLPINPGIIPTNMESLVEERTINGITACVVESAMKRRAVLVCLRESVVWLSADLPQSLNLENDPLSGPRTIDFDDNSKVAEVLRPMGPFTIPGSSVNIDSYLALVSLPEGFNYIHAGNFNHKSVAADKIVPLGSFGAWQMTPGVSTDETWRLAHAFSAKFDGSNATVTVQDGPKGHRYRIRADLVAPISQKPAPSVWIDSID